MTEKDFIYKSMSDSYEPYTIVVDEKIPDYMKEKKFIVGEVFEEKNARVTITYEGGGTGFPIFSANQTRPKVGDELTLYLENISYIHGMKLNDEVIFYRNEKQTDAYYRRTREDYEAKEKREKLLFKPDLSKLGKFKTKKGKEEEWSHHVKVNCTDAYSFESIRFASKWAEIMERKMKNNNVASVAQSASREADTNGITGFMYGAAVCMLSDAWKHGEALRQWHNENISPEQSKDANAKEGAVLNPALLTLG